MSDRFRQEYKQLSDDEHVLVRYLKVSAANLEVFLDQVPDGREKSVALTKLEECVMWAVKGVTS